MTEKRNKSSDTKRQLYLVGIGTGSDASMTQGCRDILTKAHVIYGASRILEAIDFSDAMKVPYYQSDKILEHMMTMDEDKIFVAAFSGDTGFFSGAATMKRYLEEKGNQDISIEILPGISSLSYFASKIGRPYQNVKILSRHGRSCHLISQVRRHEDCFIILSGCDDLKASCRELQEAVLQNELRDITIYYGYQLSYPEEESKEASFEDVEALEKDGLYVLWVHHEGAREHVVTPGIPDEAFLRDKVPMTKEEIRMVSLCKMHLTSRSVVWDVGAGSGSVSIEAAVMCPEGEVYAVEMKETAIALLKANKAHFAADNMYIVEGAAPESLQDLPAPTHVFVGGSSGEMEAVLRLALEKNPKVRIVINAITVETIAEATRLLEELPFTGTEIIQMQVSHAEKLGRYHLMKALNPIYILSATGCGAEG